MNAICKVTLLHNIYIQVASKSSVTGTRKQEKEDRNKLTTLAFKIIPVLHNKLLATPKINFFLGLLQFLVPTN
jgi:hypothetical protein